MISCGPATSANSGSSKRRLRRYLNAAGALVTDSLSCSLCCFEPLEYFSVCGGAVRPETCALASAFGGLSVV